MDNRYYALVEDPAVPGTIHPGFVRRREEYAAWEASEEGAGYRDRKATAFRDLPPFSTPATVGFKDLTLSVPRVDQTFLSTADLLMGPCRKKVPLAPYSKAEGLSAEVLEGEMLLVLAPPASGVSSLLRVLGTRIDSNVTATGRLEYGGVDVLRGTGGKDFRKHAPPVKATHLPEEDQHLPALSVEQTFRFAAELSIPLSGDKAARAAAVDDAVDKVIQYLGLGKCRDTIVGDELRRGVSGGEKKRVSIGEALLSQGDVCVFDGWSRGLDSATALQVAKLLRALCNASGTPFICALYQTSPDIFALFDKVVVLHEGKQLFYGRPEDALPFAERITGLAKSRTQTPPDFLTSLPPQAAAAMRKEWASRPLPALCGEGAEPPAAYPTRGRPLRATSYWHNLKWLTWREALLTYSDMKSYVVARGGRYLIQGLILGILFHGALDVSAASTAAECQKSLHNREGILSNSAITISTGSFALIPDILMQRGVFTRHKNANLFAGGLWAVVKSLWDIPLAVMECLVFVNVLYWLTGLSTAWDHYMYYLCALMMFNITMSNLIRSLVYASKDFSASQGITGTVVIILNFFNGFVLARDKIPVWWIWAYYISPSSYVYKGLVVNEYGAVECGGQAGMDFVKADLGINITDGDKWWQLLYLFGFNVLFTLLGGVAASVINFDTTVSMFKMIPSKEGEKHQAAVLAALAREQRGEEEADAPVMSDTDGGDATAVPASPLRHAGAALYWENLSYTVPLTTQERSRKKKQEADDGAASPTAAASPYGSDSGSPAASPTAADIEAGVLAEHDRTKAVRSKTLLHQVDGYCKPGTLLALMGATGAGKTTLMDILAHRKTMGTIEGRMALNREVLTRRLVQSMTGYVEQQDLHHPRATVREAVRFSAALRGGTKEDADEVITLLGLDTLGDALIGSANTVFGEGGIPLEALKRVTIAVEMVSHPRVLFMDEPTSGLDASGAMTVMKSIRAVANAGRAVVCTIHQPSADLFTLFDSAMILHEGRVAYFGPLGEKARTIEDYFRRHKAEERHFSENAAETVINIVKAPAGGPNWADVWAVSPEKRAVDALLASELAHVAPAKALKKSPSAGPKKAGEGEKQRLLAAPEDGGSGDDDAAPAKRYKTGYATQFKTVMRREIQFQMRNPTYNLVRFYFTLFIALLFGTSYWDIGHDEGDVRNYITVCFVSGNMAFIGGMSALGPILESRPSFYRELSAGTYSEWVYAFCTLFSEFPMVVINALLWVNILFWMSALPPAAYGFWFLMYLSLLFFWQMLGMAVGAAVSSFFMAQVVLPMFNTLWVLHSGFLILSSDIPVYMQEFHYANPLTYYLRASVTTVFHHNLDEFSNDFPDFLQFKIKALLDPGTGPDVPAILPHNLLDWHYSTRWMDFSLLSGCSVFFMICYVLLVVFKRHIVR
eukprot:TRINITY_DN4783_c2_g1_i1.p1 TRINITY_DN4783_c2_g1~~TRINITY_DN4783_c2_g1_i1.p1  ORF type:complete len:1442 (+),score=614.07 TRINITY_DN4783_c2_g1_i1:79-4326(+)